MSGSRRLVAFEQADALHRLMVEEIGPVTYNMDHEALVLLRAGVVRAELRLAAAPRPMPVVA